MDSKLIRFIEREGGLIRIGLMNKESLRKCAKDIKEVSVDGKFIDLKRMRTCYQEYKLTIILKSSLKDDWNVINLYYVSRELLDMTEKELKKFIKTHCKEDFVGDIVFK